MITGKHDRGLAAPSTGGRLSPRVGGLRPRGFLEVR